MVNAKIHVHVCEDGPFVTQALNYTYTVYFIQKRGFWKWSKYSIVGKLVDFSYPSSTMETVSNKYSSREDAVKDLLAGNFRKL